MDILETVSQELTQVTAKVNLQVERVSNLPFAKSEDRFRRFYRKDICTYSYWIPWTRQIGAWIDHDGFKVSVVIREDVQSSDIKGLMLGLGSVITGVCLNLQGEIAIHANAIALEGLACAFVGRSGMGKSTLTAYCAREGADFINDDVLIVDEGGLVTPGDSRLKLYPHTGKSLGLNAPEAIGYQKNFYDMGQLGAKFHSAPLPLGIIYLLEKGGEDRIYSEQLPATQAVFNLLTHSYYASKLIEDNPSIFNTYINLVRQVSVKRLFYPSDFQLLPQVYDFLCQEVHQYVPR